MATKKSPMNISGMVADAFRALEMPRFGGASDYGQVFHERYMSQIPEWAKESKHLPRVRRTGDSMFQAHVAAVNGPINPALLPFSVKFIGYPALTLLRQNILLQNIVTTFAEEMTKNWCELSSVDESISESGLDRIRIADQKFKGQALFRDTLIEKGYAGGCLLFIDVGDDNFDAPLELTPESIPRGCLDDGGGFRLVECMNAYAMGYNAYDPLSPNYFIPQYWNILGRDVHASRFLYFAENQVPMLLKPAYQFFGIPLPQMLLDYIYNAERSRDSSARAIRNHSLLGLMTDLSTILQSGECPSDPQSILNRLKIFQATRDQNGLALLQKDEEEFFQITTPLGGFMELVSQQMELIALATRMPVTKLFGTPPRGFNATGEIDEQHWAQVIAGMQRRQLADNVEKYFKIICLSEFGEYSNALRITWPDIREVTKLEKANLNNLKATQIATLVTASVIDPMEARETLAGDKESGFDGIHIPDEEELIDQKEGEAASVGALEGMNRIQITALQGIVAQVAAGEISPVMGENLIMTAFPQIDPEKARVLVGGGNGAENQTGMVQKPGEEEEGKIAGRKAENPSRPGSAKRDDPKSVRKTVSPNGARSGLASSGTRRKMASEPRDRTRVRTG